MSGFMQKWRRRRVEETAEMNALVRTGQICPRCRDCYKRGIDGTCVDCGAAWPLPENSPSSNQVPDQRRGT